VIQLVACPQTVLDLVETFERNRKFYASPAYNEAQLRKEFLDPLFETLGWDVNNKQGYAPAYRDVIHEDSIKVGGFTKAPDYCFRIGGTRKFFVEAKKPSVNLRDDISPAFQLRRYAWSNKLPLSILTDFEEFAVYDCRVRPAKTDKASVGRTMYFKLDDFADKWEGITEVFSREAVLKGSFDKYAETAKGKRGTAEVDVAFLKEIESWRELLAKNLALRNSRLSTRDLNFAVQATIDRIVFLRICEDRGIEDYGRLLALTNGPHVYARLFEHFQAADERYNSGLFHFRNETGQAESPDEMTPDLKVDDSVLNKILRSLYYPDSPYEFSVLPADILGQTYEQFLGKVIRLTPGHRAVVEDKPEVKKAGGVYYTPTYIVDYIVRNTVGKLVEGKKPPQVAKLKILDPACGSGSFLIGAYQYLLDWHRNWYVDDGSRKHHKKGVIFEGPGGEWRLTTPEKKRILLNNIFGVDIDPQAVEVTKLSLLLKVLENETQLSFLRERALPDLGNNIKCGNSLIATDFYDRGQLALFDEEERYRINPLDWDRPGGFPEIMEDGGFSAVIGNPPYGALASETQATYYRRRYRTASASLDSFALFIEKSAHLLRHGGHFGMIVQSAWVSAPSLARLREVFASSFRPIAFASMPYDVFNAYVDTVVVVAERLKAGMKTGDQPDDVELVVFPPRFRIRSVDDFARHAKSAHCARWIQGPHNEFLITLSDDEARVVERLEACGARFADFLDIQRGVTPFKTTNIPPPVNPQPAFSGTVRRYLRTDGEPAFLRYDDSLAEYKPRRYFEGPRLLLREMISRQFRLQATYVTEDFVTNKSMQSLLPVDASYQLLYALGLLNSRVLSWYFLAVHSVGRRDDFPKIVLKQTRELPFAPIDFSDPRRKASHDNLARLVERMLRLNEQLQAAKTNQDKSAIDREIDATDRRIDELVYEVYGLTEEEIGIVEGSARPDDEQ